MDPEQFDLKAFRARQKARNRALGVLLGALVVLFFAITIVKLGVQAEHRQAVSRPAVAPVPGDQAQG